MTEVYKYKRTPIVAGLKQPVQSEGRYVFHPDPGPEHAEHAYLPRGLLIWGATEESFVHQIICDGVAVIRGAPVCALFFGTARTFEQIQAMALADGRQVPSWVSFPPVAVSFEVIVTGKVSSLATWGYMRTPL